MNGRVAKKVRKEAVALSEKIDATLLAGLREIAKQETGEEAAKREGLSEFIIKDRSGKSYDGAYALGYQDASIWLARKILGDIEYEVSKVS